MHAQTEHAHTHQAATAPTTTPNPCRPSGHTLRRRLHARPRDTAPGTPRLDQPEPAGASFAEPPRTAPAATYGDRS
jgi:hypothetical protein